MTNIRPEKSHLRLSVIIPTYNYARFLPQAIESVLAQTVKPMEILVADDGSTDDTKEVVARHGDAVRYRRFDHCGVYAVRQAMLAEIRGDWFLNLDADNWICPDFIKRMLVTIEANAADEKFAFVYPDVELHGDSSGWLERPEFDAQKLKQGNYVDMNSVIRTEVARGFGFDPAFNSGQGDYDFFLTLAENGYRGTHVPEAVLHYRVHGESISHAVGRKRSQRSIMRRIVQKHRGFFTPGEARAAMAAADNRTLVALITSRSPFAGFGRRLADWLLFARAGWRHAEFLRQTAYCFSPRRFFEKQEEPAKVFYLFRDTLERRKLVRQALDDGASKLEEGQMFGFDALRKNGIAVDCNLRFPRVGSVRETVQGWVERRYAPQTGIGLGDVCSLLAHLWQINRAQVVVATTDNTGLPAAHLKAQGRLKVPLVYVSVGLPERLKAVEVKRPALAKLYQKRLASVDRFVAYGYAEAEWLRDWLYDGADVRFVPFGVDTEKWRPAEALAEAVDVLGIGADPMRDFGLLTEYARLHPEIDVCLVTSRECATELSALPPNIRLRIRIPIEELKTLIARARVVVLPVKENTYSGATTTLLQCMAMGKAIAVSRVGAIREGYGFEGGGNLLWMEPGSLESLTEVVSGLLADGGLRRRLGEGARRHVTENLDWSRYVAKMGECLAEWTQKGGGT